MNQPKYNKNSYTTPAAVYIFVYGCASIFRLLRTLAQVSNFGFGSDLKKASRPKSS